MTKPRVCFVGHSYHQQTRSSAFFTAVLEEHFEVSCVWDEAWHDKTRPLDMAVIDSTAPSLVIFWQELPRPRRLRQLRCRNWLWVPMHDSANYKPKRWRKYRGCRLRMLHFSAATQAFFDRLGYPGHTVRYYPPAREVPTAADPTTVLFWMRRAPIGWPQLKALLGAQRPARVILRYAPDPGEVIERPSAQDMSDYRIEWHEGWMPRERYAELLAAAQIFMAPRVAEGIGMAHLEAMALGRCVIAPNAPTMNEYLRHGDTGLLYVRDDPRPLPLEQAAAIGVRARQAVADGHARWLRQIPGMIEFLKESPAGDESLAWRLKRALHV